jgi:hypothetical protein
MNFLNACINKWINSVHRIKFVDSPGQRLIGSEWGQINKMDSDLSILCLKICFIVDIIFNKKETMESLFGAGFHFIVPLPCINHWEVLYTSSKIAVCVHLCWIRVSTMHFLLIEPSEVPGLEGHGWRKAGVSTFRAHQRTIEQCAECVQLLALIRYFLNVCMLASGKDGKLQRIDWEQHFYYPLSFYKNSI